MNPIVKWVMQTMMKGQTGVMRTLPDRKLLDLNVNMTVERLIRNGIDPSTIKTPGQLDNIIKQIEQPRVIPADSKEGKKITDKLLGKKGEVVDMTGKKIKPGSKIMGGKKVTETNDINKIIADIKGMEPTVAMKEANSVIGRKGQYKNLTPEQSKKILQDTEDHIFQRDPDNLYNYDPEDMADGGVAGLLGERPGYQDGLKVYPKITASKSNQGLGDGKNVDLQDLTYGGTLMYDQGPFSTGIEYLKGKDKFDFKDIDDTLAKDTTDRELANLILMIKLKNGLIKFKGNKDNQMINISKSFAQGGPARPGYASGNGVADGDAEKAALGKRVRQLMDEEGYDFGEAVRKAMEEGYADGGRIGFQVGGSPKTDARMQNTREQNIKNIGDARLQNTRAQNIKLNQIQRNINERMRKGSKTQGLEIGQLTEGMYGKPKTEYNLYNPNLAMNEAQKYGAATNMGLRPEQIKAVAYYNTLKNNFGDQGIGMAGPSMGPANIGGLAPGTNPFGSEKFFKTPAEQFALYQEGLRQQALQGSPEIYFDADKTYDAGNYVSPKGIYTFRDDEFLRNLYNNNTMNVDGKEYASEQDAIDDMGIERYNQFMAKGGRARQNFKMGKRAFLKLMGGVGAGIAGLKSGLLGFGGKQATKKAVTETVKQTAGSGTPPPYFFKLVEKIKTLGDDTLATQDKAIAKKYKDYTMEEDFAGNIEIIKKGDENLMLRDGDVYMSYKVDEVPVKGKKGSTKVEEYEEFTARPDAEGKMKDVEPGVPDEVVQEGTMFEDNMTEFGMTKKADGGLAAMLGE